MGLCHRVFLTERLPVSPRGTAEVVFVHVCIREAHDEKEPHYSKYWPLGEVRER